MKRQAAGDPASRSSEKSSVQREEERFVALLERNRGRIGRLCRAFSRTRADREDLESEVCFQLWQSLSSYDGRAAEDTWIYRVALNTCLLHGRRERGRRRGREALESEQRPAAPVDSTEPTVVAQIAARERLERLLAEIRRLDAPDRALMTLHLEELPYRRIAEITGLSESNVGVRLHRLKKRIQQRLAPAQSPAQAGAQAEGPNGQEVAHGNR